VWRAGDDARRRPVYIVRSVSEPAGAPADAAPTRTTHAGEQ
jgi:hypothetical protein